MERFFQSGFQSSEESASEEEKDTTEERDVMEVQRGYHKKQPIVNIPNKGMKVTSLTAFLAKSDAAMSMSGAALVKEFTKSSNSPLKSSCEKKRENEMGKKRKKWRSPYDSDSDSDSEDDERDEEIIDKKSNAIDLTPSSHAVSSVPEPEKSLSEETSKPNNKYRRTSAMTTPSSHSTMTLGDLMRPERIADNSIKSSCSSYFAKAKQTSQYNGDKLNSPPGICSRSGSQPASQSKKVQEVSGGDKDDWMEDDGFEDITPVVEKIIAGRVKSGNKRGRPTTNKNKAISTQSDDKGSESYRSDVVASKSLQNMCPFGKDDDDDGDEDDTHRPDFLGTSNLVASDNHSLTLTYKDAGSTTSEEKVNNSSTHDDEKYHSNQSDGKTTITSVPVYTMKYLKSYQIQGVKWLWGKYANGLGCILGDDMGLGKTVQIAAFLMAVYGKSGRKSVDVPACRKRSRNGYINEELNNFTPGCAESSVICPPCLIIGPASLMTNWQQELDRWGYFLIATLTDREASLVAVDAARRGQVEVVLGSYNKMEMYATELASVMWSVIIWDEGHTLKNDNTKMYKAAANIRKARSRIILSGTPVQNKLEEFWCLLNLVTAGRFNDKASFKSHFDAPIKKSQQHSASDKVMKLGEIRIEELRKIVRRYLLQRKKEVVLKNELLGKDEIIVYCEMTPLQKALYQEVLSLPDVDNCRYYAAPCHCGSSSKRSKCCSDQYVLPYLPGTDKIDPRAIIWKNGHVNDEECDHCPSCILMPVMAILSKISSHPILLQAPRGCDQSKNAAHIFAKGALSPTSLSPIGGAIQSSRINDVVANVKHSGKMKILETLLNSFCEKMDKTLLFSYSTKTLQVIENYVKARGWRYCRLDGTTLSKGRQTLVDKFNNDKNILVFLISTKAGGVGLNLTSANKVIIFDCNWNPAQDAQAQDRAYRMGQTQHVSVYRLIAQGTIEELAYMRQKYKQVLQKAAIGETEEGSMMRGKFEGIQGDSEARGELFGAENMLNFIDGSLLLQLRQQYDCDVSIPDNCHESNSPVIRSHRSGADTQVGDMISTAKEKSVGKTNKLVTLNEQSAGDLVQYFAKKEISRLGNNTLHTEKVKDPQPGQEQES